jgi:hypothetical protein
MTFRIIKYKYERSTQNYHIYRELDASDLPVPNGLPKEQYALNCRPDIYVPMNGLNKANIITLKLEATE